MTLKYAWTSWCSYCFRSFVFSPVKSRYHCFNRLSCFLLTTLHRCIPQVRFALQIFNVCILHGSGEVFQAPFSHLGNVFCQASNRQTVTLLNYDILNAIIFRTAHKESLQTFSVKNVLKLDAGNADQGKEWIVLITRDFLAFKKQEARAFLLCELQALAQDSKF